MTFKRFASRLVGLLTLALVVMAPTLGRASGVHPVPGQSLDGTASIGDLIATAGQRPVHIVFVHGMRAEGRDGSATFRKAICRNLHGGCTSTEVQLGAHRADLGETPPSVTFDGELVWSGVEAWKASRPFVDRYVFHRASGGPIIVDEINWWPLLFPLKCRALLLAEARLAGADAKHLKLCGSTASPYYPWLTAGEVQTATGPKPRHSGGAWANRALKAQIMDWGLSDAVIALGPMQTYLHTALNDAFAFAATYEGRARQDQDFVIVSESLGSFVVLDALHRGRAPALRQVLQETYQLYFFANQFRLLELGRVPDTLAAPEVVGRSDPGPLAAWAQLPTRAAPEALGATPVRQIIAFNDPSDALTFEVPQIEGAKVVNLYDRNGFNFLNLAADPIAAHTGHSRNKGVLRTLFELRAEK